MKSDPVLPKTTCVALLRGVNVGGNNIISMTELRAAMENAGFSNVVTYINSGNILFDSDMSLPTVKAACESLIQSRFGLKITAGIFAAAEIIEALEHAPEWWAQSAPERWAQSGPELKHNAIFVIHPATAEEICALVGETWPEYESAAVYGNVIFWSAAVKTFSRSRWSKVVENKSVYNSITIRNANTAKKLADLARDRT